MGQGPESHDMMARADLDTFCQLPWKQNVAIASCNIYVVDGPLAVLPPQQPDPDDGSVCIRRICAQRRLRTRAFPGRKGSDGSIRPWDPQGIDVLAKPCYDFKGMCQTMDYLQDIIRFGNQMGFGIYQSDHEDANGQYEINFGWTNALHTADRLVRFRMLAGQTAGKYGATATFLAKPFDDKTGSGAHLHFHVADTKDQENLFPGQRRRQGPQVAGAFRDGHILYWRPVETYRALTAVSSPIVNCYRRIQSGEFVYSSASGYTWTPSFASYGDNNRTQLYRCPDNNRVEDRSPSAMVNPYLFMAAHMAAGLDGITNKIDPGDPIIGENVWNLSYAQRRKRGMIVLPQNLLEAIEALEADEVVKVRPGIRSPTNTSV
jgi:glutamine synthetase